MRLILLALFFATSTIGLSDDNQPASWENYAHLLPNPPTTRYLESWKPGDLLVVLSGGFGGVATEFYYDTNQKKIFLSSSQPLINSVQVWSSHQISIKLDANENRRKHALEMNCERIISAIKNTANAEINPKMDSESGDDALILLVCFRKDNKPAFIERRIGKLSDLSEELKDLTNEMLLLRKSLRSSGN